MNVKAFERAMHARDDFFDEYPDLDIEVALEEDSSIPGFASESDIIVYNPKILLSLNDKDLKFAIQHEIFHIIAAEKFNRRD